MASHPLPPRGSCPLARSPLMRRSLGAGVRTPQRPPAGREAHAPALAGDRSRMGCEAPEDRAAGRVVPSAGPARSLLLQPPPGDGRVSRPSGLVRARRAERWGLPAPRLTAAQRPEGWGGRIRTFEWRIQSPLPYHLATPQRQGDRSQPSPDRGRVAASAVRLGRCRLARPGLRRRRRPRARPRGAQTWMWTRGMRRRMHPGLPAAGRRQPQLRRTAVSRPRRASRLGRGRWSGTGSEGL